MSIIIKGMEMPKSCDECEFHVYHSFGEFVCVATPMFYPMNLANCKGIRKDWCPLIELPPHGDLIDKQMLLRNIADNQFAHSSVRHEEDYAFWGKVWDYINDAPIVVESEDKDG